MMRSSCVQSYGGGNGGDDSAERMQTARSPAIMESPTSHCLCMEGPSKTRCLRLSSYHHNISAVKKDPNRYPKGWNRKKVKALIAHYENQSDEEAIAEDEAAYRSTHETMMAVPTDLVPTVRKLIERRIGRRN